MNPSSTEKELREEFSRMIESVHDRHLLNWMKKVIGERDGELALNEIGLSAISNKENS